MMGLCARIADTLGAEAHHPAVLVHLCRKQVTEQSAALGSLPINNQHAAVARLPKSLQRQHHMS